MQQIRARVREKRGVDYTEQEIRDLAAVKLEKFLDPTKVRSELLEQYRQLQQGQANPNTEQDEETLFGSPRPWLRRLRRLLRPILKLFVNPVPLMRAARLDTIRHAELFYELMHNLVVETTRLGIEVKNLKMRVESLSSRLDFDERRARALEGGVQYRPAPPAPDAGTAPGARKDEGEPESESAASRARRRRRRRGRRGGQRGGGLDEATGGGARPRADEPAHEEGHPASEGGGTGREPGAAAGERAPVTPEAGHEESHNTSSAAEPIQPREADRAPQGDPGGEEPGT